MIQLHHMTQDDPQFLARGEAVAARVAALCPRQIYIVRIDNWFSKRWVGFAGKVLGAAGVSFREDLVIPPFVPNRVVDQICYELTTAGEYAAVGPGIAIHQRQSSADNLRRKVATLFPNAALIWFSSNSQTNMRGAILAYVPCLQGHEAWFAELRRDHEWRLSQSLGVRL